jgi:hypothetical protein
MFITCNLGDYRYNGFRSVSDGIQEDDKVTKQSDLQIGQEHLHASYVANTITITVLLLVRRVCYLGNHQELSDMDCY